MANITHVLEGPIILEWECKQDHQSPMRPTGRHSGGEQCRSPSSESCLGSHGRNRDALIDYLLTYVD